MIDDSLRNDDFFLQKYYRTLNYSDKKLRA